VPCTSSRKRLCNCDMSTRRRRHDRAREPVMYRRCARSRRIAGQRSPRRATGRSGLSDLVDPVLGVRTNPPAHPWRRGQRPRRAPDPALEAAPRPTCTRRKARPCSCLDSGAPGAKCLAARTRCPGREDRVPALPDQAPSCRPFIGAARPVGRPPSTIPHRPAHRPVTDPAAGDRTWQRRQHPKAPPPPRVGGRSPPGQ
jgi:hypothetical protein